ncbi:replication and recombination DNA helicase [Klebsiella phage CPRSB]|nr:replication and recombination DNA helicase [Klebsiella phage CPRSB]
MIVDTIFSNLIYNGTYFVQAWPHLKRNISKAMRKFCLTSLINMYRNSTALPSKTALEVALDKRNLSDVVYEDTKKAIQSLKNAPEDLDWLMKETETYCKDKAMYRALSRAIEIQANAEKPLAEQNKKLPGVGAIPEIMEEALAISFDSSVGHDYFEDYEKRWMLYQSKAMKIPFGIPILNAITKGGAERGTLNIIMAGVNVGKSLGLCSLAADYLQPG